MRFAYLDASNPLVKSAPVAAFFPAMIDFYEGDNRDGVLPQQSAAVIDGNAGMRGDSAEIFCVQELSLRRPVRIEHLIACSCCNDYRLCVPTHHARSEVDHGTSPPVHITELGTVERVSE